MFRSIGAPRSVSAIQREQRCIDCGYNLHTIPMESRCPECGKHVTESLGPYVHPGTPWQNRKAGGALAAWWRCVVDTIREPKNVGHNLRVGNAGTEHRSFLAIHLAAVWCVGAGAVAMTFYLVLSPREFSGEPELWIIIPLVTGCLCLAATSVGVCACALMVGMSQSLICKRNLLPSAMQAASYLSGFLIGWAILGATLVSGLIWMAESGVLDDVATKLGLYEEVFATLLIFVPNAACGAFFLQRLVVATAATRYANK